MHTQHHCIPLALLTLILSCTACNEDAGNTCRITRQSTTLLITSIEGTCQGTNFEGEDLSFADLSKATLRDVICPDGTNSDDNGGSCDGHLRPNDNNVQDMGTDDIEDLNEREDLEQDMPLLCGQTPWEPQPCGLCNQGTTDCVEDEIVCANQQCGTLCTNDDQCGAGLHCINDRCTNANEVFVPSGTFTMGSTDPDLIAPQRQVTLTRPFIVTADEVTQLLWEGYGFEAHWDHPGCTDLCPATDITWYETIAFSNAISADYGLPTCYMDPRRNVPYDRASARVFTKPSWPQGLDCTGWRLPTEAEWEYMARATTTTTWFCGDDAACLLDVANFDRSGEDRPSISTPLHANLWHINEVAGNVAEWTWDHYGAYQEGPVTDPLGPTAVDNHVIRGGCYDCFAVDLKSASRDIYDSELRASWIGFRLVRSVTELP